MCTMYVLTILGTYAPVNGTAYEANCKPCSAGMYCEGYGLSEPTGLCYAGYYCLGGAASATPRNESVSIGTLELNFLAAKDHGTD